MPKNRYSGNQPFESICRFLTAGSLALGPGEDEENEPPEPICR